MPEKNEDHEKRYKDFFPLIKSEGHDKFLQAVSKNKADYFILNIEISP